MNPLLLCYWMQFERVVTILLLYASLFLYFFCFGFQSRYNDDEIEVKVGQLRDTLSSAFEEKAKKKWVPRSYKSQVL